MESMPENRLCFTKEDNVFVSRCLELNVTSQGEALGVVEKNIKEAVELYLESLVTEDLS